MDMMVSKRDWTSSIPKDILHAILDKLLEPRDHANFGVVCRDWHLARKNYIRKHPLLPMLIVPTQLDIDNGNHQNLYSRTERSLYCISTGKLYDIPGLSVPDKVRNCGSSQGWLATVEKKTTIVLVNPFKNALTVHLPPLDFMATACRDEYNIQKVILTADPISNPDSYCVVAIYGPDFRLAFYKSSQNSWFYIDKFLSPIPSILDVIMYKGLAYAIDRYGNDIISFDVNSCSEPWELKQFKEREPIRLNGFLQQYLVASSEGELLQVQRCIDLFDTRVTKSFEVFKLQLVEEKGEGIIEKVEVKSLGKDAIFVGDNHSFAVPIDKYLSTRFRLCQPNSIYYTGDFCMTPSYENNKDVGSFNFEHKTFRPYYKYHPCLEWNKQMPVPLWITPPLH